MSIGDINSTARGSGARFNDGKVELHQVPLWVLKYVVPCSDTVEELVRSGALASIEVINVVKALGDWQQGNDIALDLAAASLMYVIDGNRGPSDPWSPRMECCPVHVLDGVARVLMYGAQKYKRGNWAKGMKWSAVMDSALRHLLADIEHAGTVDKESGLPHLDHALCNLFFLLAYRDLYQEGDDRITEFFPVP